MFNSQVSVQPIVNLNFVLETIPIEGSTADLVAQTLRWYHTGSSTSGDLRHIEIKFNLQLENLPEYQKAMNSRLSDLDRYVFLLPSQSSRFPLTFAQRHSRLPDEDNGQLFVNSEERVDVEEVSLNLMIFSWTLTAQKVFFSPDTHFLGKMAGWPQGHSLVPDEPCQGESLERLVVCRCSVSPELPIEPQLIYILSTGVALV
jgi:hypothetical protein